MLNNTYIYFSIFVPILGALLFIVNKYLSVKNVYSEKVSPFECGLSSFSQTRSSYHVAFILIAILFLPFDLEISSLLPYSLVLYLTHSYGLTIIIIFTLLLIVGFCYEFNTNALTINKNHIKMLSKNNLYNNITNGDKENDLYK